MTEQTAKVKDGFVVVDGERVGRVFRIGGFVSMFYASASLEPGGPTITWKDRVAWGRQHEAVTALLEYLEAQRT